MCYILIAKQISRNPVPAVTEQIKEILEAKMRINSDGYFITNDQLNFRSMDSTDTKAKIKDASLDNLICHFRMISAGAPGIENVHGWEIGDWQFCHNGTISSYVSNTAKEQKKSDSLQFFEDLVAMINKYNPKKEKNIRRAIQELVGDISFQGRCVLYQKSLDRMYLFGDWRVYSVGGYLLISSIYLDLKTSRSIKEHGFELKGTTDNSLEGKVEGIAVITKFSTTQFELRDLGELRKKVISTPANHSTSHYNPIPPSWDKHKNLSAPNCDLPVLPTKTPDTSVSSEITIMTDNLDSNKQRIYVPGKNIVIPSLDKSGAQYFKLIRDPKDLEIMKEFSIAGEDSDHKYLIREGTDLHDFEGDCCIDTTVPHKNIYSSDWVEWIDDIGQINWTPEDEIVRVV